MHILAGRNPRLIGSGSSGVAVQRGTLSHQHVRVPQTGDAAVLSTWQARHCRRQGANETLPYPFPAWIGNSAALHVSSGLNISPQMPRAGHELHEPAGPSRRDSLSVESRFDMIARCMGLDPMLPAYTVPQPPPRIRPLRISPLSMKRPKAVTSRRRQPVWRERSPSSPTYR